MSVVKPGIVLFGGSETGANVLDDTWVWDGFTWVLQNPLTVPPARTFAAMSTDPPNQNVVMFGGSGAGGFFLGDTWTWDGTNWTEHLVFPAPSARRSASMAYSTDRNAVVLFGGLSPAPAVLGDTWLWDGSAWTDITGFLTNAPAPRLLAAMAAADGTVYIAGGSGFPFADAWRLDPTTWTPIAPITPARTDFPGSSYGDGEIVVAGGDVGAGTFTTVTEEYDPLLLTWTAGGPLPTARSASGASLELQTGDVILFGGIDQSGARLDDTLRYTGTWALLAPAQMPSARQNPAMATIFCMAHNTLILMADGTYKMIQDIRKGDWVQGDRNGTTHRVAKVIKQKVIPFESKTDIVIFEKNALEGDLPLNKLIVLGNHTIIWNGKKRPAGRFMNYPNVTRYYNQRVLKKKSTDNKIYSLDELLPDEGTGTFTVYDLQFETEGSYIAEGLQVKSRSPLSKFTPLETVLERV